MKQLTLSIGEPFTSPAWGSNFVVFSGESGAVISEQDSKEYIRKVCKYAKHYEVYLVPERFMLMGFECLCLVSPQGTMVGAQRAVYLGAGKSGVKRSSTVGVFSTEFGGVFLCVDVDIYHPEVVRIAKEMGADFIFCVQQMPRADYSTEMVLTGVWNAAQSNNIYTIAVSNQFHCICAPRALTPENDGFIVRPTLKTPLSRALDANLLGKLPRRRLLSRSLYATHRRELIGS